MKFVFNIILSALLPIIILTSCKEAPIPAEETSNNETYIVALDLNHNNTTVQSTISPRESVLHFLSSRNIKTEKVRFIYEAAITGFAAELTGEQVEMLRTDKDVSIIEKDKYWSLGNPTITGKPTTGAPAQKIDWGVTAVGSSESTSSVKVWILDTGIDLDHPDLNVNISLSRTFVPSGSDASSADDANGHGSHVAGIIGAKNNSIGTKGIVSGIELVAVKVLNKSGTGMTSWILKGLDYIAQSAQSGDVVNMSLGGTVDLALDQAVANCSVYDGKNIYIAVAAGNNGTDANSTSPARIGDNFANVVTVSAHNELNVFASFSNYGTPIEWCAPGTNIYSTYKSGKYATLSGTSMACPHVAGIMALKGGPQGITFTQRVINDPDGISDPLAHI